MKKSIRYLILLASLLFMNQSFAAITVDEYTNQVAQKNGTYLSGQQGQQGYQYQSKEATLKYLPQFFVKYQTIDDRQKTNAPVFQGTRTTIENISSGISMLGRYGTQSKIYYSQSKNKVFGVNPAFFNIPQYYYNGWNLELTQHLWQDGFGKKTMSQTRAAIANSLAAIYNNQYLQKSTIIDARSKFWQLASTIEAIENYKQSVEIAQKTYDYLSKKQKLGLADKSDVIKIQAYLVARKYDLENANLTYKTQIIEFNNARGSNLNDKVDNLSLPSIFYIKSLSIPKLDAMREDIKAKKELMTASNENYNAAIQALKPTLDLVVNASLTGRSATYNQTMSEANQGVYPYSSVMLNFSVPIDYTQTTSVIKGYKTMQNSAKLSYTQTVKNSQQSLESMIAQFEKNKYLLTIMSEVVEINKKQVDEERKRYKVGKTDLYQLCLIEQGYLNAQNNLITLRQSVLMLYDQIMSYEKTANSVN